MISSLAFWRVHTVQHVVFRICGLSPQLRNVLADAHLLLSTASHLAVIRSIIVDIAIVIVDIVDVIGDVGGIEGLGRRLVEAEGREGGLLLEEVDGGEGELLLRPLAVVGEWHHHREGAQLLDVLAAHGVVELLDELVENGVVLESGGLVRLVAVAVKGAFLTNQLLCDQARDFVAQLRFLLFLLLFRAQFLSDLLQYFLRLVGHSDGLRCLLHYLLIILLVLHYNCCFNVDECG
jgi:hypothetical protein